MEGERHFIAVARVQGDRGPTSVKPVYDASAGGATTDRAGRVLVAGTATNDGAPVLARLGPGSGLEVARGSTRLTSATWRAVAALPDGRAVVVGSGRGAGARSVIAVQPFAPDGSPGAATATAVGDSDAYAAGAAVDDEGRVLVAASGIDGERPAAFVLTVGTRGPPRRAADGRAAGIAPSGQLVASRWDGERQTVTSAP